MTITNHLKLDNVNSAEKKIFGHRVECVIENRGISKAWIAEKLGISKQALNYLLKNATKPKFIDELSELLELNPQWIETGKGNPNTIQKLRKLPNNKIPVLAKAELLNPAADYSHTNKLIDFSNHTQHVIAYKLDDNSNFPPFIQDSILLFDKNTQVSNGDYVLLKIENEIYVRQFVVDGNNACYKASSSEYKTFINSKAILLGVLFEARYQLN